MKQQTHLRINTRLCGEVEKIEEHRAVVVLKTTATMAADDRGLVHGGFTFGAADFAAMVAINDPNVVLAAAQVRFLAPVVVGDVVRFEARVQEREGKKAKVKVVGSVEDRAVFEGLFSTYTPDRHILDA